MPEGKFCLTENLATKSACDLAAKIKMSHVYYRKTINVETVSVFK